MSEDIRFREIDIDSAIRKVVKALQYMATTKHSTYRFSKEGTWLLEQGAKSVPCSRTSWAEMAFATCCVFNGVVAKEGKEHLYNLLCSALVNDREVVNAINAYRSRHGWPSIPPAIPLAATAGRAKKRKSSGKKQNKLQVSVPMLPAGTSHQSGGRKTKIQQMSSGKI
jgi:hypothetical protein